MYELKQSEIDSKVNELLLEKIAEPASPMDDMLHEAIGNDDGTLINVIRRFANATSIDDKIACHDELMAGIKKYFDLAYEAESALIAERGTIVRTDVDDYKFVPHDTRY